MEQRGERKRKQGAEESRPGKDAPPTPRMKQNAVGPAVRRLRYAKKITQDTLAARCGVAGCDLSRGTLAKIEAQIRGVTEVELFTLAKVLRVRMDELFPPDFTRQLKRGIWQQTSPSRKEKA